MSHPFPLAQKNAQCPTGESYPKGCTPATLRLGIVLAKLSPQILASNELDSFAKKEPRSLGSKQNTPEVSEGTHFRLTQMFLEDVGSMSGKSRSKTPAARASCSVLNVCSLAQHASSVDSSIRTMLRRGIIYDYNEFEQRGTALPSSDVDLSL